MSNDSLKKHSLNLANKFICTKEKYNDVLSVFFKVVEDYG